MARTTLDESVADLNLIPLSRMWGRQCPTTGLERINSQALSNQKCYIKLYLHVLSSSCFFTADSLANIDDMALLRGYLLDI